MISAVSISKNDDNRVSDHFVRCKNFLIINHKKQTKTLVPNPYFLDKEDAGIKAVKFLLAQGVTKIIAGDFGVHVQDETHIHKIQLVIVDPNKIDIKALI